MSEYWAAALSLATYKSDFYGHLGGEAIDKGSKVRGTGPLYWRFTTASPSAVLRDSVLATPSRVRLFEGGMAFLYDGVGGIGLECR